jgi:predicted 3-demethylubiquinone-9 3-methyltransferase (glyoxalase superfamily)
MQSITPCLWFDDTAEEAASFYVSVFPDSEILNISRYGEGAPMPAGTALVVNFRLDGLDFQALNGGPEFTFDEAVSFQVTCDTQDEIDYYWEHLTADGGQEGPCGWCKDKFGLSWQVVPAGMAETLNDPDRGRANRSMAAMMTMGKIELAALRAAADSE